MPSDKLHSFKRAVAAAVHELLMTKGRVVLPDWGALLASKRPARFDGVRAMFFPPGIRVAFNPLITADDGELFALLHREWGWPLETIAREWDALRNAWQEALETHGEVLLEGVGVFYRGQGGRLTFEIAPEAAYRPETWMLPAVPVPPGEVRAPSSPVASSMRGWGRVAALWAVVVLGFWAVERWMPGHSPATSTAGYTWEAAEEEEAVPVETTSSPSSIQRRDTPQPAEGTFYIIVGSYRRQSDALLALARYQNAGYSAQLIARDGRYRVAVAEVESESAARQLLPFFQKKLGRPDAWILHIPATP